MLPFGSVGSAGIGPPSSVANGCVVRCTVRLHAARCHRLSLHAFDVELDLARALDRVQAEAADRDGAIAARAVVDVVDVRRRAERVARVVDGDGAVAEVQRSPSLATMSAIIFQAFGLPVEALPRPSPAGLGHHEARVRQLRSGVGAAGMIELAVRDQHVADVLRIEAEPSMLSSSSAACGSCSVSMRKWPCGVGGSHAETQQPIGEVVGLGGVGLEDRLRELLRMVLA